MADLLPAPPTETYQPLDLPLKSAIGRLTHGISPAAVSAAMLDWWTHLAASPGKRLALAESASRKTMQWLAYVQASLFDGNPPCAQPSPQDRRFVRPQWEQAPYSWMSQGFLLWEQWWQEAATGVRGVARHDEDVAAFVIRQALDMTSPSNYVLGNPVVLQQTLASGGQNLVRGALNWWRDAMAVQTGGGPAGAERFTPGKTVAVTPGQVVLRNHLIELIQYRPTRSKVHPEPVLIVPSWIMKYYILDLSAHNSMVKYLVDQGHTVFMISWRNPDASDRDLAMDDYVEQGVLAALDAVQRALPGAGVHAAGYCLGGTLLAIAAAALAGNAGSPLKTLSLLAAQIDFEEPGELGLFIDESQIAFLEDLMAERGYLDGRQMAGAFALINSKDLVWSKLANEYLMGAQTPLTDLRAWNADATRMPYRMHGEYLRRLYLNNDLAEARFTVRGRPVAMTDIRLPLFALGTERDHVSPWQSVYKIHLLTDTEVTFVLSSGGHNVGIVNPPAGRGAHRDASYRIAVRGADAPYQDAPSWMAAVSGHAGSWWPAWHAWLMAHSGAKVTPAPIGGSGADRLRPLGDAPGTYVLMA